MDRTAFGILTQRGLATGVHGLVYARRMVLHTGGTGGTAVSLVFSAFQEVR